MVSATALRFWKCLNMLNHVKPRVKHFDCVRFFSFELWNILQNKRCAGPNMAQHMSSPASGLVDLQLSCQLAIRILVRSRPSSSVLLWNVSDYSVVLQNLETSRNCSAEPSACPTNSRLSRRTSFMRKHSRRAPVQVGLPS